MKPEEDRWNMTIFWLGESRRIPKLFRLQSIARSSHGMPVPSRLPWTPAVFVMRYDLLELLSMLTKFVSTTQRHAALLPVAHMPGCTSPVGVSGSIPVSDCYSNMHHRGRIQWHLFPGGHPPCDLTGVSLVLDLHQAPLECV